MKQKHLGLLLVFIALTFSLQAQDSDRVRIGFYNLENLFDAEDDSLAKDEDFLPNSLRKWDEYRYAEKCNRMAKVILSMGGWKPIDMVGVCEVENMGVLNDLIETEPLKKIGYDIVHYESPDRRGIDVGLLYNKETVKILHTQAIPVVNPDDLDFKTRDILYAKVEVMGETVHCFVNHWPSRYGGQMKSEPKRILASQILRKQVDSIQAVSTSPHIVLMGDFNDYPDNISITENLQAVENPDSKAQLKNLMQDLPLNEGTHRYRGEWGYLDQIMVSDALLNEGNIRLKSDRAYVHKPDFLIEEDDRYPGDMPFRTFLGVRYNKGFSDHLPVYIDLIKP